MNIISCEFYRNILFVLDIELKFKIPLNIIRKHVVFILTIQYE